MDVAQTLYDWWLERFEHHEREAQTTRHLLGTTHLFLKPRRTRIRDEALRKLTCEVFVVKVKPLIVVQASTDDVVIPDLVVEGLWCGHRFHPNGY